MIAMLSIVATICRVPPFTCAVIMCLGLGLLLMVKAFLEPRNAIRHPQPRMNDTLVDRTF